MSEVGIRIGAAGNQAAEIMSGMLARGDVSVEQASGLYSELITNIVDVMNALEAAHGSTPVGAAFEQAFPGTEVVIGGIEAAQAAPVLAVVPGGPSVPPAPAVAPPVPAAAGAGMPAVAGSQEEGYWMNFFENPSSWWDNRFGKKNPNGPDFKSKEIPSPDNPQYKVGLWIGGRTQPAWVDAQLTAIGMNK